MIKDKITRLAFGAVKTARYYGPVMSIAAGTTLCVAAVVTAAQAGATQEKVAKRLGQDAENAKEVMTGFRNKDPHIDNTDVKESAKMFYVSLWDFIVHYRKPIVLSVAGVGLILGGTKVLHGRVVGLTGALAAVSEAYDKYRDRAKELFGEDADEKIRMTVPEGDNPIEERIEEVMELSPYARVFEPSSRHWSPNPEERILFLKRTQQYFNDRLRLRGHVFLNEVLESLDIPKVPSGQLVGWLYNKDGDNFVDFGIFSDPMKPRVAAFFNGSEDGVILDFNVDGPVWNKL